MRNALARRFAQALGLAALGAAIVAAACGGGGGGSPTNPSGSGGGGTVTITLTSAGANPRQVFVEVNQRVRFVNNDSRTREIASGPHPTHNGCPPLNEVGVLSAGQSRESGVLTRQGTCTFHDNLADTDVNFQGQILVGVREPGPEPVY